MDSFNNDSVINIDGLSINEVIMDSFENCSILYTHGSDLSSSISEAKELINPFCISSPIFKPSDCEYFLIKINVQITTENGIKQKYSSNIDLSNPYSYSKSLRGFTSFMQLSPLDLWSNSNVYIHSSSNKIIEEKNVELISKEKIIKIDKITGLYLFNFVELHQSKHNFKKLTAFNLFLKYLLNIQ